MKPAVISTWLMQVAQKNNLVLDVDALHFQHQLRRIPLDSLPVIHSICDDFYFYNVFNGNTFDQHTVFVLPGWNAGVPSQDPGCAVAFFSTCNCLLDFVRLQRLQGHSRGVNLQMDHVFKVMSPSLSTSTCYRHPFCTSCFMHCRRFRLSPLPNMLISLHSSTID